MPAPEYMNRSIAPRYAAGGLVPPLSLYLATYWVTPTELREAGMTSLSRRRFRRSIAIQQTRLPMPEITCREYGCTQPVTLNTQACRTHLRRCVASGCMAHVETWRNRLATSMGEYASACDAHYASAVECQRCGDMMLTAYAYQVVGDHTSNRWACYDCYSDSAFYCDQHARWVWRDEHAASCRPSRRPRSWDYRPVFQPRRMPEEGRSAYTYGVELEVGVPGHYAGEVEDLAGEVIYVKRDGSVHCDNGDDGMEIVTHPMTMAWFQENQPFASILPFLAERGTTNSSCGLHVHVDRRSIEDDAHLSRLLHLWCNDNVSYIRSFCGRISERYARPLRREQIGYQIENWSYSERYVLINLLNQNTIEFRGFAGTLSDQSIRAAVEISAASVAYTAETLGPDAEDWTSFGGWVFKNAERYPALVMEWFEKGIHNLADHNPTQIPVAAQVMSARQAAAREAAPRRYRGPGGRFARRPQTQPEVSVGIRAEVNSLREQLRSTFAERSENVDYASYRAAREREMRRAEGTPRFRRPIESDPRRAGRVDGSPRAYRIEDELDTYRGEPQQPAQPDGYTPTCPCDLCVEYRRLCGVYREYQESQARQRSYVEQMSAYTMSEGDVYNTFGVDPGIVRGARGDVVINDSSEGWNLSWVDPVATRRTITLRPNEDGSSVTWNDDSSITVEYQGQVMRFTNDVETTIHPDGRIVISYRA